MSDNCVACGAPTRFVSFPPYWVTTCTKCHVIKTQPVLDPRIPSLEEHLKCLQQEIQVEEQEAQDPDKVLLAMVIDAKADAGEATLRLQLVGGKSRWLVKGSRTECYLGGEKHTAKNMVTGKVTSKARDVLDLRVDDPEWKDLKPGVGIELVPQTSATIMRNLLKAFLLAKKWNTNLDELTHPKAVPDLTVPGFYVDVSGLRPRQADAVRAALGMPEAGILLVQGPPGTGKTTVIARFLSEAVKNGKTVLVTSHTHVAIDNALRKAIKANRGLMQKVVRLGDSGSVAEDMAEVRQQINEFYPDPNDSNAPHLFEAITRQKPIVGMTLDALAASFLYIENNEQKLVPFDYVVVDEAGMNSFPKIALAHTAAKRTVLVGDPLQLPPIVRAWSFRNDANYKRSHFEAMQLCRPDLCIMLNEQFRCDPGIYEWSNGAVYAGQVASHTTQAPRLQVLGRPAGQAVVWVDTQHLPECRDEKVGTSRINKGTIELSIQVMEELMAQGLAPSQIGYITPFRAQAEAFHEQLQGRPGRGKLLEATASTVDAFQGNERKAIVYDLTTRVPAKPHEDFRRLNVSLTRAQNLLVIVGPRNFVLDPKANPFYWSLQNWATPEVVRPVATPVC